MLNLFGDALLINEVTHPRISTVVIAVIATLLIFGGIQSRMNRRKWAAHIAYLEAINSDDEVVDEDEGIDETPEPIVSDEPVDDMIYDDDDIELV